MKDIRLEYKCRRCHEFEINTEASEKIGHSLLLEAIHDMQIVSKDSRLSLLGTHSCDDGGMGITDLVGYSIINETNEIPK